MTGMCIAAANYLIKMTNAYNQTEGRTFLENIPMTCKRLQKLLYFSEVVYMKRHNGKSMLKDDFYAWPSGPVIPSVYYRFQDFQGGTMEPLVLDKPTNLSKDEEEALDFVFEQTKELDTLDLVELSHNSEGPWSKVYNPADANYEAIVTKDDIYDFYKDIKESELFSLL